MLKGLDPRALTLIVFVLVAGVLALAMPIVAWAMDHFLFARLF